jgi:hypothetical protein
MSFFDDEDIHKITKKANPGSNVEVNLKYIIFNNIKNLGSK